MSTYTYEENSESHLAIGATRKEVEMMMMMMMVARALSLLSL